MPTIRRTPTAAKRRPLTYRGFTIHRSIPMPLARAMVDACAIIRADPSRYDGMEGMAPKESCTGCVPAHAARLLGFPSSTSLMCEYGDHRRRLYEALFNGPFVWTANHRHPKHVKEAIAETRRFLRTASASAA